MAIIERLSLGANGGIIVNLQKAPQANCAVVAIGLGGTGCDCLAAFKKSVYNQIQPDDPEAFIPEYKHFQFIAIDSDGTYRSSSQTGDLTQPEFISLKPRDIAAAVKETNISIRTDIREWFLNPRDAVTDENGNVDNRYINTQNIADGAGGIRQVGRLYFMYESQAIYNKINDAITKARADLQNPDIYIYIFAGISGGTGSGGFLDVCYLTRKVVADMAVQARISGFFFLPDVVVSRPGMSEEVKRYNMKNGIAALKELDYCMQFDKNGDKWHQDYCGGSVTVDTDKQPVDLCHLISATKLNGDLVENPYEYAMGVVSSYLMDFATSIEEVGPNAMTFNGHIANFTSAIGAIHRKVGAFFGYCILGASTAIVPQKEIMTYLVSHLFGKFAQKLTGDNSIPGGQAADNFAREINLDENYLLSSIATGANTQPKVQIKPRELVSVGSGWLGSWLNEQHDIACGVFDKNASNMRRDLPDNYVLESVAGMNASLIAQIFSKLTNIAKDTEKGPLYADALINSPSNRNLIAVVDGLIEENHQRLESALYQKHHKSEYDEAKAQFDAHPRTRTATKLIEKAQIYEANWILIEQITKLGEVLAKLKKQLENLQSEYFGQLSLTIKNLIETFKENRNYLEAHKDVKGGDFEYYLMTIQDLEPSLQETVKSIRIDDTIQRFIEAFIAKPSFWMGGNENEIAMEVSGFFGNEQTGVFKEYTNMTINTYLETKYQGQYPAGDDNALAALLAGHELGEVSGKANPVFWMSAAGLNAGLPNFSYFNTPSVCNAVNIAAQGLATGANDKLRTLKASDKISVIRCRAGAPAFGYQGLDIYEGEYSSSFAPGKHYHEGKVTNYGGNIKIDRDWRSLAIPKPLSLLDQNDRSPSAEALREAGNLFEKALEAGVITVVPGNGYDGYYINTVPQVTYNSYFEHANEALSATDRIKVNDILAQLDPESVYVDRQEIPFDGYPTDTDREEVSKNVAKDHFCDYPAKQRLVKEELAKKQNITEIYKEVVEHKEKMTDAVSKVETFVSIFCTSKVILTGPKIVLKYFDKTMQVEQEIVLSIPSMQYGSINIYQAYITLFENKEVLKNAAESAKELLDRLSEDDFAVIKSACAIMDELLSYDKREMFIRTANDKFPEDASKITDVISRIMQKANDFKKTYGI